MKKATKTMKTKKRNGSKKGSGEKNPPATTQPIEPRGHSDERINTLGDWRDEMLARIRVLIKQADPEVVEERKWRKPSNSMLGVPVWSNPPDDGSGGGGIICTGEIYKNAVKMTFAKGASLADPSGLFNSSLEGNTRRAIDLHQGDRIDEKALKALIRAAVALNTSVRNTARPVRSLKKPKSA